MNEKVISLKAADYDKADMAMLVQMEKIPSAGGKREFADHIGLPWEEYLRIARKYRVVLDRMRKEKKLLI